MNGVRSNISEVSGDCQRRWEKTSVSLVALVVRRIQPAVKYESRTRVCFGIRSSCPAELPTHTETNMWRLFIASDIVMEMQFPTWESVFIGNPSCVKWSNWGENGQCDPFMQYEPGT